MEGNGGWPIFKSGEISAGVVNFVQQRIDESSSCRLVRRGNGNIPASFVRGRTARANAVDSRDGEEGILEKGEIANWVVEVGGRYGVDLATLAGSLPYFFLPFLNFWQVGQVLQ